METAQLSFELSTSDAAVPLAFEAWIDDECIFKTDHVTETVQINYDLPEEDDAQHSLRLIMNGKTQEHTRVDEQGNITQDARLSIAKVCFDEIELGYVFLDRVVYVHNFNGTGESVDDRFFGEMGCNGTVELKFSSPVYLWLLENM
jgi:hypothetical protein